MALQLNVPEVRKSERQSLRADTVLAGKRLKHLLFQQVGAVEFLDILLEEDGRHQQLGREQVSFFLVVVLALTRFLVSQADLQPPVAAIDVDTVAVVQEEMAQFGGRW